MEQAICLLCGVLQHLSRVRTEGDLHTCRIPMSRGRALFGLYPCTLVGHPRLGAESPAHIPRGSSHPQEQMVGLDGRTAEPCDLCSREEQRSSSALVVAFEHPDILRSGWAT